MASGGILHGPESKMEISASDGSLIDRAHRFAIDAARKALPLQDTVAGLQTRYSILQR